jgi:hypothetical protein
MPSFFSNLPVFSFLRNGQQVPVQKDTVNPANTNPLPVELTGASGDVAINAANLHLEVQTSGFGANPDSMQITDGTNTLAITPSGGIATTEDPLTFPPVVVNVPIALANTEQTIAVAAGVRQIEIYERTGSRIKYAFVPGQSGTTYVTLDSGTTKFITGLSIPSATSIYVQATKPNSVLELVFWS